VIVTRDINSAWFYAKPYIEMAMKDSLGETAEDLHEAILGDKAQLWISDGGAAVSRVLQGKKKAMQIVAMGGDNMREWLDEMVNGWKEFAKEQRCDLVMASGRRGWKREMSKYGFGEKYVTIVCEVSNA
jgi:hypothetical protein